MPVSRRRLAEIRASLAYRTGLWLARGSLAVFVVGLVLPGGRKVIVAAVALAIAAAVAHRVAGVRGLSGTDPDVRLLSAVHRDLWWYRHPDRS